MLFFDILSVVVFGLVLGSFTTAIAYRIPRGIPWAFERKGGKDGEIIAFRSACTNCKTKLKVFDLIPVFSWVFTKGRCRYCQASIGAGYPLTELGVVFACLGVYLSFGLSVEAFFIIAIIPFLIALIVVDLEYMILPNELVIIVGVIGLLKVITDAVGLNDISILVDRGASAAIYGLLAWFLGWSMGRILKKEVLGFGDVKFFAVVGLWLGLYNLAAFCFLSGVFGVLLAFIWQSIKKDKVFPFGPALIVAFYTLLLFDGSFFV